MYGEHSTLPPSHEEGIDLPQIIAAKKAKLDNEIRIKGEAQAKSDNHLTIVFPEKPPKNKKGKKPKPTRAGITIRTRNINGEFHKTSKTIEVEENKDSIDQRLNALHDTITDLAMKIANGKIIINTDDPILRNIIAIAENDKAFEQAKLPLHKEGTLPDNIKIDDYVAIWKQIMANNDIELKVETMEDPEKPDIKKPKWNPLQTSEEVLEPDIDPDILSARKALTLATSKSKNGKKVGRDNRGERIESTRDLQNSLS